jgi:hypothetical protein
MAEAKFTPDSPSGPRRSGSRFEVDTPKAPSGAKTRGTYPADKSGPPEFSVGRAGKQGDEYTADVPATRAVDRLGPRASVKANTLTNPLR